MPTYDLPGVYPEEKAAGVPRVEEGQPARVFVIGKFAAGPIETPTLISQGDLLSTFGGIVAGSAAHDAYWALLQGNRQIYVCRTLEGTKATVTIQDRQVTPADKMKLTAKVGGTWANYTAGPPIMGITANVAAGSLTNTFKLTLKFYYKEGASSTYFEEVYDNLSLDDTSSRYFPDYVNARTKLVLCEDLAPANKTPPDHLPELGDAPLLGGVEPVYTTAITAMAQVPGRLVAITDTDDSTNRTALINAVNARELKDGSVCVLNNLQYATVAEMEAVGQAYGEERAVLTGSWFTALDQGLNVIRAMRPAGFHAGILASRHPTISPTNKKVYGAVDVERKLSRANLVSLQEAGIQPAYWWPDDEGRGIRVINGIATDGSQVMERRSKDWVAAVAAANSSWAVGELQGEADPDPLRTGLKAQFDAYYEGLLVYGIIERYLVQCDADNNPPAEVQARKLHVRHEVKLKQVADYIILDLVVGTESVIAREAA